MRILIVDDERPARDKLRRLLAGQSGIEAVDEAVDAIDALARIPLFRPDALFLDIEMPELSGLELAASLPEPAPLLVFVTAWNQYAIRAFDLDAIDYLLKPYDAERLQRALQRLRARVDARTDAGARGHAPGSDAATEAATGAASEAAGDAAASASAATPEPAPQKLPRLGPLRQLLVSERGGTRVVRIDEIRWIETADNYVVLHTASGSPLLRQTLAGLVDRLGPDFVRCHRRAAVRLACIERLLPLDKGDCELQLQGGMRAPCSRQYRAALLERLGARRSRPERLDDARRSRAGGKTGKREAALVRGGAALLAARLLLARLAMLLANALFIDALAVTVAALDARIAFARARERIGVLACGFLLGAQAAFGLLAGVARHFLGQGLGSAAGVLQVLLGDAGQLDLGVGRQAGDVLLVGAQLVAGRLGARCGGAQQFGLAVGVQHLLAGQGGFFQHGLDQLDVQVEHLLEGLEHRLGHVIQERGLGIDVGANRRVDRSWKRIHAYLTHH